MKWTNHIVHFSILSLILAGGVVTFFTTAPHKDVQLFVGITTTLAYVVWGIMHHSVQRDLHKKVVVEYILIGVIAIALLFVFLGS